MDPSQRVVTRPSALSVLKNPVHLLATGFGSGLSPRAPGTTGSLAAVVIYLLALAPAPVFWQLTMILLAFLAGIFICGATAIDWNSPDHSAIVWDEWIAQWLVLVVLPLSTVGVIAGFVLFRIFDIWKPWPVYWIDKKVHGGLGIMLDDIAAGMLAVAAFFAGTAAISWLLA